MRPIISNTGMATYEIAKYLNKLLTPLKELRNYNHKLFLCSPQK